MKKPVDHIEFLIRFVFGMLFFGAVVALLGIRFITALDALAIGAWAAITFSLSLLVAHSGDDVWRRLASILRWW